MGSLSLESLVSRQQEIIASDIDGNTVMMSVENGKYYGLDTIASRIWLLLQEPLRIRELVDRLLDSYDVERETCTHDVLIFLEGLSNDGLLQVSDEA